MSSAPNICSRVATFGARCLPLLALGAALVAAAFVGRAQEVPPASIARVLTIEGAIGPATSSYVVRGIEAAARTGAELVVLDMDTPGGLDTSMREIVRAILGSPVPVVGYVTPRGARAASAGTYILYASHVAAMAPATNLGAATPIAIGGPGAAPSPQPESSPANGESGNGEGEREPGGAPLPGSAAERKAVNDAVAYIRSLAEERGRNADWAERAVRSGESASAETALALNVIEIVAVDHAELLQKLDGRSVSVEGGTRSLATAGLALERHEPDWRTRLLTIIGNPTVAYLLMLMGIYGLVLEGYNPGALLPGTVGAIALLLALFAFQILPVNYAGLALIALGIVLMVGELFMPSFGVLGIGGIVAFVFGSVILVDSDVPGFEVSRPLIGAIAATAGAGLLGVLYLAVRSRHAPVVSGVEQMIGSTVTALADFEREGVVLLAGERWNARSRLPVRAGQELTVKSVRDLVLEVEPRDIAS